MGRPSYLGWVLGASFLGMVAFATMATTHFNNPFPPISASLASPVAQLSDFAGIAMGSRRLAADVAWIQTLLYYGTHEEGSNPEEEEQGGGKYFDFLAYCQRVVEIDPYFKHIFYYGGGVLGWNLNRLNQAEELLEQGIKFHPKEWRFQQFLAGLAYQKNHDVNKLMEFLQCFVTQEDCPNLLRSILANLYKKQGRYREAFDVWNLVYQTGDPLYRERSLSQMKEIVRKVHDLGQKAH